jgi:FAD-dependent urate hydroxylase
MSECEVAIVGAGPYGLSIAAHLRNRGADLRIFGVPLQSWRNAMPAGMFLKSDGAGTNLSAPGDSLTLADYCASEGVSYSDHGRPISLQTFVDYGLTFQRRLVPEVEAHAVMALAGRPGRFEIELDTGEYLTARKVVLAVGTTYFSYVPHQFSAMPRELVTHSSDHCDFSNFAGRDVIVLGGGQSALETAALLNEQGAGVQLLVRRPCLKWNPLPSVSTRSLRLTPPHTALGQDWRAWFYCSAPGAFYYFPQQLRRMVVQRALGPAGAWWLKSRVLGRFPVECGRQVLEAREVGGRIRLSVACVDGQRCEHDADHVIAATGYKVDTRALRFLDSDLFAELRREGGAPALSPDFQASIPGLYFAGLVTATQFGPAMRFVCGAEYTARRIAQSIRAAGPNSRALDREATRPANDGRELVSA